MEHTHKTHQVIWLRTDRPIVPMNAAMWSHLPQLEATLHRGVRAVADANRAGFYDIEIDNNWYYIHIPSRISGVYLVAAGRKPVMTSSSEERMFVGMAR